MEIDEVFVKDNPGLCRCCLSEGCYKDLASNYAWMGDTEIYADMLLECFDISISQQVEGPNGLTRLICEVCITRLRDACNFKKQVVESENKFIDMIGRGEFRQKVYETSITKQELTFETEETDGTEPEYLHGADYTEPDEDDEVLANLATTSRPQETPKRSRGRPKKTTGKTTPSKTKVKAEKKKVVKEEGKKARVLRQNEASTSTRAAIVANLQALLTYTNATPFKWLGNNYMCFFCDVKFKLIADMKTHLQIEHEGFNTPRILKHACDYNRETKVEITDLKCNQCSYKSPEFDTMTAHLREAHSIAYDDSVRELFLPFRLTEEELKCLECGAKFIYFMPLLIHVNKEHCKGSHMCTHCGRRFAFRVQLESHFKRDHTDNKIHKCDYCEQKFQFLALKRTHEMSKHKKGLLKCTMCEEEFATFYLRKRHMTRAHDPDIGFTCVDCGKKFIYKNYLIRHQRVMHGNHKVACQVCGESFSEYYLKVHMVTHSDARPHVCEICNRSFRRHKNLKVHLKTHTK